MFLPAQHWWTVFSALRAIADWPRARFAAERMLEAASAGEDPATRRYRFAAQTFLAETFARDPDNSDDLSRSEKLYLCALELSRALARELDTPEARRDVSVSLVNLARIADARGNPSQATLHLKEARASAEAFGTLQPISDSEDMIAAIDQLLDHLPPS